MLPGEEADVGRSPNWYHFTYTYGELLENPAETIASVLEKLTLGLERYHKLLSHMKGEYWSISKRFKKAQVIRLERKVDEDAKEQSLREMQDLLLDAYSEWKKTGERKLLEQMRGLAREIRQLSPDFHFSLPAGGS
jgi:recombinational DNA repair protein (RecF pathway)